MTRFELGNLFVELEREGAEIHRRWGALGRSDFNRVDSYADPNAAEIAWTKQLRRLEHRGYRPGRRDERFERAILSSPDDTNTYLVYADWLQEQNDPRGLLISTMAAGRPHDALLNEHAAQFVPTMRKSVKYQWKLGFIERAHFEAPTWASVRRLLRHPSALVLRTIEVTKFELGWGEAVSSWNALVPLLPPTLTRIGVESTSALWTGRDNLAPELRKLVMG